MLKQGVEDWWRVIRLRYPKQTIVGKNLKRFSRTNSSLRNFSRSSKVRPEWLSMKRNALPLISNKTDHCKIFKEGLREGV